MSISLVVWLAVEAYIFLWCGVGVEWKVHINSSSMYEFKHTGVPQKHSRLDRLVRVQLTMVSTLLK